MLATYPEVFAGGAIIGGLPYACAGSVQEAFEAMFTDRAVPGSVLRDRVTAASSHRGPWPKISVWHGTADAIVKPSNAENIIRQWCGVHGLPERPSSETVLGGYPRRVWNDTQGNALIEAVLVTGMAHGVPLAPHGHEACGAVGPFFLDAGISSTHHIARFWGLETADVTETTTTAVLVPADGAATPAPGSVANSDRTAASGLLDPNAMIAAAFKAAGLPIPEAQHAPAGSTAQVSPGPIIEAAMKAAGLARK
jgi:feruloyl esterase